MARNNATGNGEESKSIRYFALRLRPHEDLKRSILSFAVEKNIKAGAIVTCVGSLEQLHIRYANRREGSMLKGHFEILSLTGTFSGSTGHFHLSAADGSGVAVGGHLLDDNFVYTTAEIVIADLVDLEFLREQDPTYGYLELVVKKASDER